MPSIFNARDADSYEQTMGRWSRRLAPLFIEHAGAAAGERLLEVGCRTGSLTFALAGTVAFGELTAIDYADVYVAAARAKNRDPHPHRAGGRGRAVLPRRALRSRAVAPGPAIRPRAGGGGGADAAGHPAGGSGRRGGMGFRRWASRSADILGYRRDAGRRRGRAARRAMSKPVVAPGGLARLFSAAGLADVDERPSLIRMEHADFADYWEPFLNGEGPMGAYVAGLGVADRARLEHHLRAAYLAGAPDGPRSFAAIAWSCRGVVPSVASASPARRGPAGGARK
jgi:SAM-dependent methyltransferase